MKELFSIVYVDGNKEEFIRVKNLHSAELVHLIGSEGDFLSFTHIDKGGVREKGITIRKSLINRITVESL